MATTRTEYFDPEELRPVLPPKIFVLEILKSDSDILSKHLEENLLRFINMIPEGSALNFNDYLKNVYETTGIKADILPVHGVEGCENDLVSAMFGPGFRVLFVMRCFA